MPTEDKASLSDVKLVLGQLKTACVSSSQILIREMPLNNNVHMCASVLKRTDVNKRTGITRLKIRGIQVNIHSHNRNLSINKTMPTEDNVHQGSR